MRSLGPNFSWTIYGLPSCHATTEIIWEKMLLTFLLEFKIHAKSWVVGIPHVSTMFLSYCHPWVIGNGVRVASSGRSERVHRSYHSSCHWNPSWWTWLLDIVKLFSLSSSDGIGRHLLFYSMFTFVDICKVDLWHVWQNTVPMLKLLACRSICPICPLNDRSTPRQIHRSTHVRFGVPSARQVFVFFFVRVPP